jgi:hypothetical protein
MSLITQHISPLLIQTNMFSLISLEKFTHKILFQDPMYYAYLCTLKNKIVLNQFYLINVTSNGFVYSICVVMKLMIL